MRKVLYIAVFISGMVSLAAEMAASRLLGNYFGTSNLVWASIIGLILIYLTFGYFLGGKWADRSPHMSTFLSILAWASLALAIVPIASRPILKLASQAFDELWMGDLIGSFAVVMVLFIIPITLLGTASPFAIRIAIQDAKQAGEISGRIYAISTMGSFFGTFLPSIILIPLIGTYMTFLVISSLLLIFSLIALGLTSGWKRAAKLSWMAFILLGLAIFGTPGANKIAVGMVKETESAYNYIQVLEQNGYYLLRLNEGQGIHSVYHPDQLNYYGPWEQVLAAPFFNPPPVSLEDVSSMAIVGLAAGTSARQAALVYPNIEIDGYEIDPAIVDVAKEYFAMDIPQLHVIEQDGRWGLSASHKRYNIISIDAYRPPYIPWHLTTQEFFQEVYNHLENNGVMVINIGRGSDDRRLIDALGSTTLTVFPTVHVMDLPNSFNSILFATVQPTDAANLALNFQNLVKVPQENSLLVDTMAITLQNIAENPQPAQVFTDDKAPIEWLTNALIFDYFLSGEVKNLQ
jgi:predicted membrane-bound spermidine synthase